MPAIARRLVFALLPASGWLLVAGGAGLLARAANNLQTSRLLGVTPRRRAIDLQKTIEVAAPLEAVYAFWTAYENLPRFMARVLDVRPSTRNDRSHWTVVGPAGLPVHFDAEVTQSIQNQVFASRTVEGSTVGHAGAARPEGRHRTESR